MWLGVESWPSVRSSRPTPLSKTGLELAGPSAPGPVAEFQRRPSLPGSLCQARLNL